MSNINVANIVNPTTADSTPTDNLSKQVCRAWVNFNGVGTVAIRSAYNVSSITDNGVGDYTVNFENAMSDADYSIDYAFGSASTDAWVGTTYGHSLSGFSVMSKGTNATAYDCSRVSTQVFGN